MSFSPKQDLLLEATRALDVIRNKKEEMILDRVCSTPNLSTLGLGDECDVYTTSVHVKRTNYLVTVMCNRVSQDSEALKTRRLDDFDSTNMKDGMIHIFWDKYFISVGLSDVDPVTSKTEECCEQLERSVIY